MVFDVHGRLVAELIEGRQLAGWHEVRRDGRMFAPGIHLVQLSVAGATASSKMILSR